jgi:hypothetical protein
MSCEIVRLEPFRLTRERRNRKTETIPAFSSNEAALLRLERQQQPERFALPEVPMDQR